MFEHIALLVKEISAEMVVEVVDAPLRFAAEVVQFALLVGIVWVVGVGFGKRKGFLANMLVERREALGERVEKASHAAETLGEARAEAAAIARKGRAQARALVSDAKKECADIEEAAKAETDAECTRIEERAKSALETEHEEMLLELREQLVELVSSATRSIMNENLSAAEQRALIERSITGNISPNGSHARGGRARAAAGGA